MENKLKDFFSDYWPTISAFAVLIFSALLDLLGIQSVSLPTVVWFQLLLIIILFGVQAVKPQAKLRKYINSRPKVYVKRTYINKNVSTTDFIIKNPDSEIVSERYPGGTISPNEYKPAFRAKHGTTEDSYTETIDQAYALIDFVNNPDVKKNVHNADRVIARINYYTENGNEILKREVKGFWSQNPEPSRIVAPQPDISEIDIPANGDERTLCIAVKNKEEVDCFAYSSDSYKNSEFLKRPDLRLGTGTIIVHVTLSGVHLDNIVFRFRLVNPGGGRDISIANIV